MPGAAIAMITVAARRVVAAAVTLRYDSYIRASAARHGIDPGLMKAMMHTESAFNPNARSPVGLRLDAADASNGAPLYYQ